MKITKNKIILLLIVVIFIVSNAVILTIVVKNNKPYKKAEKIIEKHLQQKACH